MKRYRVLFYSILLGLLMGHYGMAMAAEDHYRALRAIKLKERVKAPEFALPFLFDGKVEKKGLKDLRGKVVLLNFWASWCPPCRKEMPSLERLYRTFRSKGFLMVGVNYMEEEKRVRGFVKEFDLTFPIFLDGEGSVAEQYRVVGIPTTFLIDKDGRIVAKVLGDREWDNEHARAIIEELLRE